MLHGTNSKISDVPHCTDLTEIDIVWHWSSTAQTARTVRVVVAFVSYSEMIESSELKEADLLDAAACLYKLGTDKACHPWSFMFKRERTATSIPEFKSYLTMNHGVKEVATRFGIMKFSTKISIHRHIKEPQFPNGRIFVCNTQDEWLIYRDFFILHMRMRVLALRCLTFQSFKVMLCHVPAGKTTLRSVRGAKILKLWICLAS